MKKRLLSMLMAVLMIASLVPATALAAGSTTNNEHATHDVLTVNIEKDTAKKQPGIVFEYCNTCGTKGNDLNAGIVVSLTVTPFAAQKDICAAGNHTPVTKVLQAETCEQPKITVTYCSACGSAVTPTGKNSALAISKSDLGGHTYSEFKVVKAPTCNAAGYGYTACDKCGELKFVYGDSKIETLINLNKKTPVKTSVVEGIKKQFAATNPNHTKSNDNIVTTDVDVKDYKLDKKIGGNAAYTIVEYTKYFAAVEATHAETVSDRLVLNNLGGMDNVDIYSNDTWKWGRGNYAFYDEDDNMITGAGIVGSKYCKDCGEVVNSDEAGEDVDPLNQQHADYMTLKQGYVPYIDSQGHKIPGVTDTWYCSKCEKTWGGTEIPYESYWGNETSKIKSWYLDRSGLPNNATTAAYYVDGDLFTIKKKAATCTTLGYTGDVYKLVDGKWVINEVGKNTPALGHEMTAIDSKAPTCYSEGWTVSNYSVCTRCGVTEGTSVVKVNKVGHDWVAVDLVTPTCESAGMTVLECSFCHKLAKSTNKGYVVATEEDGSDVYVKTIKSVPHAAAAELKGVKEATCTELGYTGDSVCKWCGVTLAKGEEIPMKDHTSEEVEAVPATCTEDGTTAGTKCSVCGTTLSGIEKDPAKGHTYVKQDDAVAATCTEAGKEASEKCSACNDVKEGAVIPAAGHKFVNGVCTECTAKEEGYNPFSDLKKGDSFYDDILWAWQNNIVKGNDKGEYDAAGTLTRAQVVQMLWNANGQPKAAKAASFSDVKEGDWWADAVAWAVEAGFISGYGDGKFGPNDACTRAQFVKMLWVINGSPKAAAADFSDVDANAWYAAAVAWAAETKVTLGDGAGHFLPDDGCTRGQAVAFLHRAPSLEVKTAE